MQKRFELVVRQQPKKGRMTGFSDDIRIIGPSLVLQLVVLDNNKTITHISDTETEHFVCSVSLIQLETGTRVATTVDGDDKHELLRNKNNLVGNWISSCHHLEDVDGRQGMFFLFPDLGVRSPGKYLFLCTLMQLDMSKVESNIVHEITTLEFSIYSPKNCPKPGPITKLARAFIDQGADSRLR
ncbi:velvet factor [Gorgonomyces haynaldii]|nr:velvet factor [Gorgonomyces haynaldii]